MSQANKLDALQAMRPIFRKCTNFTCSLKHEHQPLEGNAGTYGRRTKLAQVCPYQLCQNLAHIILRHLKMKPLGKEVYLLEDIFELFTDKQVDVLRQEMAAIDKEFNMTSSTAVRIQGHPFNKNFPPLVIHDPVQKFQRTLKQYISATEIDVFKQNPKDWRCQYMWNGCKKLRQLCISSAQYGACTAYAHATDINMPINSPPDDATIAIWQPDQLNRIWVLPASKCNWENYNPKTWHAAMYSSVHHSFPDAPAIKPSPSNDTQQPPDQQDHPMPDSRPPTPPDENMPDPPHQPDRNDHPDHPMPPAPPGVSPGSAVDPPPQAGNQTFPRNSDKPRNRKRS